VSTLDAVLVDMDGLLVDSEPLWFDVESAVFARLGAGRAWTHAEARSLVGNALEVSAARMCELAGVEVAPSVVAGWFVDAMRERLEAQVPFKPGARELLADLNRSEVPCALVSSSYRTLVDTVVRRLPERTFRSTVAGDEVTRGKPHPEPYRRALDLLGVRAERAIVLEDSPTGATAGSAAGCTVVVVPDLAPLPEQHDWHVVASLTELDVAELRRLLGGDRR
jgi:HAD superfamily hydrolase (TIGR01509 family)